MKNSEKIFIYKLYLFCIKFVVSPVQSSFGRLNLLIPIVFDFSGFGWIPAYAGMTDPNSNFKHDQYKRISFRKTLRKPQDSNGMSVSKKSFIKHLLFFTFLIHFFPAEGKLNVLTSSMNLKSLTESIAGDRIHLESIIKGPEDPHFLPAKPSYMIQARKADLLIFVGMDLEVGWLPQIIHGARNPKIQKGQSGYLDVSQFVKALSVPEGKVDRFFGDIHPSGNPHFLLDPLRAVRVSRGISERLSLLDQKNKSHYIKNQELFEKNIKEKMKTWRKRVKDSGIKQVVTYHSSFEYFLSQFQLNLLGLVEEKPGIPPSAKHILHLIKNMRESESFCILMSNFYNDKWVKKFRKSIPVHLETVAIEVMALEKAKDYFLVIEGIVQAIENCGNSDKIEKEKK